MTRYYLSFVSFLICLIPIMLVPGQKDSLTLDLLNSLMALICCVAIFSQEDKPYTLYKVFHIFMLFFFSIAPAVQFRNNVRILGTFFPESLYITTEIWSIAAVLIFNACYYFSSHYEIKSTPEAIFSHSTLGTRREIFFILISLAVFFVVYILNGRSLVSMFVRDGGTFKVQISQNIGQTEGLIFSKFFRPMPMILFLFAWMCGVKHRITLYILFLLLLLSNMPTGVARNYAAGIYIPVLLTTIPFFHRRHVFVLILTLGLLVVFPFLNSFRNFNGNMDLDFNSQFADMNFDSFSMFMRVIDYGDITYGRQLLGVLFFFIPRSIWPTKPVGSGLYIAHQTGLHFGNISMPIFAEGWLNFGAIGMIAFTLILAWFCARQDKSYWQVAANTNDVRSVGYFIFIGLLMFILRGDLLSSFAYTTGIFVSYLFCKRLLLQKV